MLGSCGIFCLSPSEFQHPPHLCSRASHETHPFPTFTTQSVDFISHLSRLRMCAAHFTSEQTRPRDNCTWYDQEQTRSALRRYLTMQRLIRCSSGEQAGGNDLLCCLQTTQCNSSAGPSPGGGSAAGDGKHDADEDSVICGRLRRRTEAPADAFTSKRAPRLRIQMRGMSSDCGSDVKNTHHSYNQNPKSGLFHFCLG